MCYELFDGSFYDGRFHLLADAITQIPLCPGHLESECQSKLVLIGVGLETTFRGPSVRIEQVTDLH